MSKLTAEEQAIEDAVVSGEFRPVRNRTQQIAKHQKIAAATLKKDKRINIRLSSRDLNEIRRRAAEEGLPYQTLIASVLHKYASGMLSPLKPGRAPEIDR